MEDDLGKALKYGMCCGGNMQKRTQVEKVKTWNAIASKHSQDMCNLVSCLVPLAAWQASCACHFCGVLSGMLIRDVRKPRRTNVLSKMRSCRCCCVSYFS